MNRNRLAGECTLESADGAPELPVHKLERAMNTKREHTSQYSLTLAMNYILNMSIANKSMLRNHYALNPTTLLKIEAGDRLSPSAHQRYLEVFVGILNQYRELHRKSEHDLNKVLADILLVECGIKTDAEREADFKKKKCQEFLKHICSTKS